MLKLVTLALWIAPAVLLFVYLLWLSRRSDRASRIAVRLDSAALEPVAARPGAATDSVT